MAIIPPGSRKCKKFRNKLMDADLLDILDSSHPHIFKNISFLADWL